MKAGGSRDLERLHELFFEIQEVKDDSQQRGWAVHDDSEAISQTLEQLLQILVRYCLCTACLCKGKDQLEIVSPLTFLSSMMLILVCLGWPYKETGTKMSSPSLPTTNW